MELLAVRTAKLIAHLNAEELNPSGRPIAHDFMNAFVERYQFIKRPTTADEVLDSQNKGLSFELGKLSDVGITKVVLFDWGVVVDTNASTEASENVLNDILKWGASEFGLSNRPNLIGQKHYVSELVIASDINLPAINPQINAVGQKIITDLVSGYLGKPSQPFEVSGLSISFDQSQTKQLFTPFQIQRLLETSFADKKYYSGAPLKTQDHVKLLQQLEEILA